MITDEKERVRVEDGPVTETVRVTPAAIKQVLAGLKKPDSASDPGTSIKAAPHPDFERAQKPTQFHTGIQATVRDDLVREDQISSIPGLRRGHALAAAPSEPSKERVAPPISKPSVRHSPQRNEQQATAVTVPAANTAEAPGPNAPLQAPTHRATASAVGLREAGVNIAEVRQALTELRERLTFEYAA